MKVRYSARAATDFATIYQYLGAANVMAAILAAIEFIRLHPHGAEKTNIFPACTGRSSRNTVSKSSIASAMT
jgi:hypothetical protein